MIRPLLFGLIFLAPTANAATYVGNGGNAVDIELAVTLSMIEQTLVRITKGDAICKCAPSDRGEGLCDLLDALNKKQVKVCQNLIKSHIGELSALASSDSGVRYVWSDERLYVVTNGDGGEKGRRRVDAIAQHGERKVIIDKSRFLAMRQSYRVALMTHELFHLIEIDGNHISDDDVVGPFSSGRALLDAAGAAIAVAANDFKVTKDFKQWERVSRGYKKFIIQADQKTVRHSRDTSKELLKEDSTRVSAFTFEYKPNRIGYRLGIENLKHRASKVDGIDVKEDISTTSLGIGYHWFPFDGYLSRWTQLHLSIFIDLIAGKASYQVSDGAVQIEDVSDASGSQLTAQAHVPLIFGFWLTAGYQLRLLHYHYKVLEVKNDSMEQVTFMGVAYAF